MPPYRALVTRSGEDRGKPYFLKNASRLQPGTGKGPQRHCQPKQLRNNPRGCFNAPRSHPSRPPTHAPSPPTTHPSSPAKTGTSHLRLSGAGRNLGVPVGSPPSHTRLNQRHHITVIPGKSLNPPNRLSGAGRNPGAWGGPSATHEEVGPPPTHTVVPFNIPQPTKPSFRRRPEPKCVGGLPLRRTRSRTADIT